MNPYPTNPIFALSTALVFGIWGDIVLRSTQIGVNIPLWFIPLAVMIALHMLKEGQSESALSWPFIGIASVFSCVPFFRDSGTLNFLCLLAALFSMCLAAASYHKVPLLITDSSHYIRALLQRSVLSVGGFVIATPPVVKHFYTYIEHYCATFPSILRGLTFSVPILFIFGTLFVSADQNYENMIYSLTDFDLEFIVTHNFFIMLFGWVALTIIALFFLVTIPSHEREFGSPKVSTNKHIELLIVLGSVNLLFMSYVYFQLGYLFGGLDHVLNTANLTVAEYARRGFFESALAAGLVLIILLAFDEVLLWNTPKVRRHFLVSAIVLITLVGIVILSGMQRMSVYQNAYGLTEDRFYVAAILVWMFGTFSWLAFTFLVQKKHTRYFLLGSTLWGFVALFGVVCINPHAYIAEKNIARMMDGKDFDVDYATRLSVDATPIFMEHLNEVPEKLQLPLYDKLKEKNELNHEKRSWKNVCLARDKAYNAIVDRPIPTLSKSPQDVETITVAVSNSEEFQKALELQHHTGKIIKIIPSDNSPSPSKKAP